MFLAKDVADWIEHSNPSLMASMVDKSEKQLIQIGTLNNAYSALFLTEDGSEKVTNNVCTPGGNQNTWFLTEDVTETIEIAM